MTDWRANAQPRVVELLHSTRQARHVADDVLDEVVKAINAAGYHVVQEGQVPPWMEKVREVHERAATPEEVDDGCELGVAYDDLYRLRPLTDEAPT